MADRSRRPIGPLTTQSRPGQEVIFWLLTSYLALIVLGAASLRRDGAMTVGNEMDMSRAVFASVNAATLTGFQQTVRANDYLPAGRITVLLLTVGATLLIQVAAALAVVRALKLPYSSARVTATAVALQALAMLAGAITLRGDGRNLTAALMQSAAALGNSGLVLGRLPAVGAWQTQLVLLPLALAGSLGLVVLMELADALRGRRTLSRSAATVLTLAAAIYAASVVAIFLLQWLAAATAPVPAPFDWQHALAVSSATSVISRTAGLPLVALGGFSAVMQWFVVLLMVLGANGAGTGGGLKATTLAELFRCTHRLATGRQVGPGLGVALTWVGNYLLLGILTFMALLACEPAMRADRLLFLSVSAVSNVGLFHEPLALGSRSLAILSAAMLGGRMMPLTLLWRMASSGQDVDLVVT